MRTSRGALATTSRALALAAALLLGIAGCGRRATAADCRLIVDRSVELQLKQMDLTDPATIQKRTQEVTSALQGELDSCQGLRVTAQTMSCVAQARTPQELDQCLH